MLDSCKMDEVLYCLFFPSFYYSLFMPLITFDGAQSCLPVMAEQHLHCRLCVKECSLCQLLFLLLSSAEVVAEA